MPPHGHSSSSHSSHSHSSHSSHHSSSSHSSHSSHSYSSSSSYRSRKNQPSGYGSSVKRSVFRCKNHDYHYYDKSWVDQTTGASYRQGYYDENGNYYKAVAIKEKDGSSFVFATCEYCGTEQKFSWKEGFDANCPNCSAPFSLEGVVRDESTTGMGPDSKKLLMIVLIVFGVVWVAPFMLILVAGIIGFIVSRLPSVNPQGYETVESSSEGYGENDGSGSEENTVSNLDIFGETIYLDGDKGGSYKIVTGQDFYNKRLKWDYGYDSYYDKSTDCYVWYNTDVAPNLWQYWYEGISSDYGDYGWMEYEDTTDDGQDNGVWYIEESSGSWVELPDKYDTTNLWHIVTED